MKSVMVFLVLMLSGCMTNKYSVGDCFEVKNMTAMERQMLIAQFGKTDIVVLSSITDEGLYRFKFNVKGQLSPEGAAVDLTKVDENLTKVKCTE